MGPRKRNRAYIVLGSESDLNRKHAKNFHSQLCMDLAAILDELGTGHIGNYLKTEIVEDMRARQKEQLLQVAHRVQSEYSFHCAALGTAQQEDVTGLATTEELLSQLESGVFRLYPESPFPSEKVVIWKGTCNCGFALICEKDENRMVAENVLSIMIKYFQEHCRILQQPTEAILKADKITAVVHQFLPGGQLLFMNHRYVRQLEKELEQIIAMK